MTDIAELEMATSQIREEPMSIELYLLRGKTWYELKCFDECASDLLFYEASGGTDPEFRKYLGMALIKTTSRNGLRYLREYVNDNRDDLSSLVFLAESYFGIGEYDSSASFYKMAIEKGYDPTILRVKAAALAESKMYDEAAIFDASFGKRSFFRR